MNINKRYHFIALAVSVILAVVCLLMIPHINVNSDMTKYLPDNSRMKQGVEIITNEFDLSQMTTADVKIMFHGISVDSAKAAAARMAEVEHVESVSFEQTKDGSYTLFSLVVPKSVDQKSLGADIKESFGDDDIIVETSQDGATPPISVVIIAAVMIFAILIVMTQSWIDWIIFLFTIGIAVLLNMGTNALLPSVSITTNYIAPILQLVLSLDYSIVLMNRYRQEWRDNRTPESAINLAIRRAYVPILSSALTTVVGLMMLAFMRLKIGLDMGFVLAKGVVCSLVCTFTVLPALLIICYKPLKKLTKATLFIPTDRLAIFVTNHKMPLAIFTLVLFVGACVVSQRTPIFFSTNGESKISEVFPKSNTLVVIYDTQYEKDVFAFADSLQKESHVGAIVSYPTLLKTEYTADSLTGYIHRLMSEMSDYLPDSISGEYGSMLTPEVMRIAYYLRSGSADTLHINFKDLMTFIKDNCMNNPLFAAYIDEDMRDQMNLLSVILSDDTVAAEKPKKEVKQVVEVIEEPEEEPEPEIEPVPEPVEVASADEIKEVRDECYDPIIVENVTEETTFTTENESQPIKLRWFVDQLSYYHNDESTEYLASITDIETIHMPMDISTMSDFMGSTPTQTRMVYGYDKEKRKELTPLQYVHLLTDDLFQRKSLSGMVRTKQKQALERIAKIMDYANADAALSADEIYKLLSGYGLDYLTKNEVIAIAYPKVKTIQITKNTTITQKERPQEIAAVDTVQQPAPVVAKPVKKKRIPKRRVIVEQEEPDMFETLMNGNNKYTSNEMADNFMQLGQGIDPCLVSLLYNYYGSYYDFNDSITTSLESLLTYVADTLVNDDRFETILSPENKVTIRGIKDQLAEMASMMGNQLHSICVVQTDLPDESAETYAFVDRLEQLASEMLEGEHYLVGESVMFSEMKAGFGGEMTLVTILTVLSIFLIVALSFRSFIIPSILVITVLTANYINVVFCGIVSGGMLYLAYLIVQSILMGATIDYGILYTNYYREKRVTMGKLRATRKAYRGSIRTIMTSGLIVILGAGCMAIFVEDVAISCIVGCLAAGAFAAVALILFVLPGILVALDKHICPKGLNEVE